MTIEIVKKTEFDGERDSVWYWVMVGDDNGGPSRPFRLQPEAERYFKNVKDYYEKHGSFDKKIEVLKSEELIQSPTQLQPQ